jgi:hypothetical protein
MFGAIVMVLMLVTVMGFMCALNGLMPKCFERLINALAQRIEKGTKYTVIERIEKIKS